MTHDYVRFKVLTVKVIGSKPWSLVFVRDVELLERLLFLLLEKLLDLDRPLPICGLISVSRELLDKEAAAPPFTLVRGLSPSSSSRSTTSSSDAEGDGKGVGLLGGARLGMGFGTAFT